ncbi:ABC transporter permease [Ferdinandcohnia quinoae]|uniref:ABC transporter permease n=1 Tax=Fredinandcohnia quinoae TaxID=2918902 RepID=A0AAW5E9U8_9BACI|nr:ABC transporter permease [Fredinandcohnia sp. SECRCQ15]MCH1626811.1 ABC transporter permease [Fredinandcohnia sp. SECRCQ15]
MIDTKDLWKKRSVQYFNEVKRYLRYMLNDHLLIALIFLLGGAAYYYNKWLKELPDHFPYALIIAVIFAFILTNSRIQTLLKEPDLVFLLPIEKKLNPYFQRAFWFSFMFQSYVLLLVFAVAAPLYLAATGRSFLSLLVIFGFILLSKVWNLLLSWNVQYSNEPSTRYTDFIIRLLVNFVLVYLLFSNANLIFIGSIALIMIVLLVYFQRVASQKGIKWDYLIDLESRRMMAFYRLANLFTDVPKLKEQVKKRAWLNWSTSFIKYSKKNTYSYLYIRTFLRTSDYLGMFLRLTIIGGLFLYFADFKYGNAVIVVLFIYLTGYQLITLWRHHSLKIWIQLYPVRDSTKEKSFLQILFVLLVIQSILFTFILIVANGLFIAFVALLIGILFSYVFVYFYVKVRVKKLT